MQGLSLRVKRAGQGMSTLGRLWGAGPHWEQALRLVSMGIKDQPQAVGMQLSVNAVLLCARAGTSLQGKGATLCLFTPSGKRCAIDDVFSSCGALCISLLTFAANLSSCSPVRATGTISDHMQSILLPWKPCSPAALQGPIPESGSGPTEELEHPLVSLRLTNLRMASHVGILQAGTAQKHRNLLLPAQHTGNILHRFTNTHRVFRLLIPR